MQSRKEEETQTDENEGERAVFFLTAGDVQLSEKAGLLLKSVLRGIGNRYKKRGREREMNRNTDRSGSRDVEGWRLEEARKVLPNNTDVSR